MRSNEGLNTRKYWRMVIVDRLGSDSHASALESILLEKSPNKVRQVCMEAGGSRRSARRSQKNGMPPVRVLKQLFSLCKPEAFSNVIASACHQHRPTAQGVHKVLSNEISCRRVILRSLPPTVTAAQLAVSLEKNFGAVDRISLSPRRGLAAVLFRNFPSAVAAVLEGPVSLVGRSVPTRFTNRADPAWEVISNASDVWESDRRKRPFQLMLRNLDATVDEEALVASFAHFGDIQRVSIKRGSGRGYVRFICAQDTLRAAQQSQRLIKDQLVFVSVVGRSH